METTLELKKSISEKNKDVFEREIDENNGINGEILMEITNAKD